MQVILMQRVDKLGAIGELVTVKTGFARNYLLPQGKAMRATKENIAQFQTQKAALLATNDQRKAEQAKIGEKLNGKSAIVIRQAAEGGQLFGSVSARDIADAINEQGFAVTRQQVRLNQAIKNLGLFEIDVDLHPEVRSRVTINVARSEDEAKLQADRGAADAKVEKADADKAAADKAAAKVDPSEAEQPATEEESA